MWKCYFPGAFLSVCLSVSVVCVCVSLCVCICAHTCTRAEEATRGWRIPQSWNSRWLWTVGVCAGNWTQVLCESSALSPRCTPPPQHPLMWSWCSCVCTVLKWAFASVTQWFMLISFKFCYWRVGTLSLLSTESHTHLKFSIYLLNEWMNKKKWKKVLFWIWEFFKRKGRQIKQHWYR